MLIERKDSYIWKYTVKHFPTLSGLLNLAFSHGGYVAGGYPRKIVSPNLTHKEKADLFYHHMNDSDVDLWFDKQESLDKFVSIVGRDNRFVVTNSYSNYAFNINFCGKSHFFNRLSDEEKYYKVQAVKCKIGSPKEVIGDFDLVNAMIGFNKTTTWEDNTRQELENQNKLDVSNWSKPNLVSRIAKYVSEHRYSGFTTECHEKLVQWLWNEFHSTKFESNKEKLVNQQKIRTAMSALIGSNIFTSEELVLFMTIYANQPNEMSYGNEFGNPALNKLISLGNQNDSLMVR